MPKAFSQLPLHKTAKAPSKLGACLILTAIISLLLLSAIYWRIALHSAILVAIIIACVYAYFAGFTWDEIQNMMFAGIKRSLFILVLMPLIGAVVSIWIVSGIVPSIAYYGVKLLNPRWFLILAPVLTAAVALTIGTSWGTASTIGIAVMAIGRGMAIPAPVLAGSIISALFFGEILSPLSGSANLTASMLQVELLDHFQQIKKLAIGTFVISIIVCYWLGINYQHNAVVDSTAFLLALKDAFSINALLLLIPIFIIILAWQGVKIIPVMSLGLVLGLITATFKHTYSFPELLNALYYGPTIESGHQIVQSLAQSGGISRMMSITTLLLLSLALAGILEHTGMLDLALAQILKPQRGILFLCVFTIIMGIFLSMIAGSQALAIMLLAQIIYKHFKARKIDLTIASKCIAGSAVVIPPLIPWNANGLFLSSVLGTTTIEYAPYALFCYLLPSFVLLQLLLKVKTTLREE